jgi:hypothetical protein
MRLRCWRTATVWNTRHAPSSARSSPSTWARTRRSGRTTSWIAWVPAVEQPQPNPFSDYPNGHCLPPAVFQSKHPNRCFAFPSRRPIRVVSVHSCGFQQRRFPNSVCFPLPAVARLACGVFRMLDFQRPACVLLVSVPDFSSHKGQPHSLRDSNPALRFPSRSGSFGLPSEMLWRIGTLGLPAYTCCTCRNNRLQRHVDIRRSLPPLARKVSIEKQESKQAMRA